MRDPIRRSGIAAALAVVALGGPSVAAASAPSQYEAANVLVSYEDLDIHSAAGARVLYGRLKQASREVCGVRPVRHTLDVVRAARACYNESLSRSVEQIESDQLKKIHAG